jgi:hypothetical protein
MTYRNKTKAVLYRSKMNPVTRRNFAVFPVLAWIADRLLHMPENFEKPCMSRRCGARITEKKQMVSHAFSDPYLVMATRRRSMVPREAATARRGDFGVHDCGTSITNSCDFYFLKKASMVAFRASAD